MHGALGPIRSDFADDPEMHDLVELFASEMPERAVRIRAALDRRDFRELCVLSHQLKGAAAGYGFGVLGQAAGAIEDELRRQTDPEAALESVRVQVAELLDLCARVRVG